MAADWDEQIDALNRIAITLKGLADKTSALSSDERAKLIERIDGYAGAFFIDVEGYEEDDEFDDSYQALKNKVTAYIRCYDDDSASAVKQDCFSHIGTAFLEASEKTQQHTVEPLHTLFTNISRAIAKAVSQQAVYDTSPRFFTPTSRGDSVPDKPQKSGDDSFQHD